MKDKRCDFLTLWPSKEPFSAMLKREERDLHVKKKKRAREGKKEEKRRKEEEERRRKKRKLPCIFTLKLIFLGYFLKF